jgi:two-component system heavy metal sensor histidine kinase CusS
MKAFPDPQRIFQLRSISTRLAIWYAFAATITLATLFAAGYQLLERHLIHGLDLLNAAQYEQIRAHLHPEHGAIDRERIEERIRTITEYAAVLFYIDVHTAKSGTLFRSHNLNGHSIPDIKGQRLFIAFVPSVGELRVSEFVIGDFDVNIATPLRGVRVVMEGYAEVCLALLGGMLVASLGIGFWLSQMALRPIRVISEAADQINSDNLGDRIPVTEVNDEVSDLARMLNKMFDRLESSFRQIRQFTAEASHELKTPLSLIRLHSEKMLVDGQLAPAQEEAVHIQLEELARLDQIINEMLFLSRAEARAITLDLKPVNPGKFLHTFAMDAVVLAEHQGKRFTYVHDGEGETLIDDKRIRQVLLNLLSNALHASPDGMPVMLHSRLADGQWRMRVEDRGAGLPASERERVFERFVRIGGGAGQYQGSGLGLTICRSIVGLHQGTIRATSGANGRGLCIVIELPAPEVAAERTDTAPA